MTREGVQRSVFRGAGIQVFRVQGAEARDRDKEGVMRTKKWDLLFLLGLIFVFTGCQDHGE